MHSESLDTLQTTTSAHAGLLPNVRLRIEEARMRLLQNSRRACLNVPENDSVSGTPLSASPQKSYAHATVSDHLTAVQTT